MEKDQQLCRRLRIPLKHTFFLSVALVTTAILALHRCLDSASSHPFIPSSPDDNTSSNSMSYFRNKNATAPLAKKQRRFAVLIAAFGHGSLTKTLTLISLANSVLLLGHDFATTYFIFSNDERTKNFGRNFLEDELGSDFEPSIVVVPFFHHDLELVNDNRPLDAPRRCSVYFASTDSLILSAKNQTFSSPRQFFDEENFDYFLSLGVELQLRDQPRNETFGDANKGAIEAILWRQLTVAEHPYNAGEYYETTNVASCAYLTPQEAEIMSNNANHFTSYAFGGSPKAFYDLCSNVVSCWRQDLNSDIRPDGADVKEIYLNKYLADEEPNEPVYHEFEQLFEFDFAAMNRSMVQWCNRMRMQISGDDKAIVPTSGSLVSEDPPSVMLDDESSAIASSDMRSKQAASLKDVLASRYLSRMARLFFDNKNGAKLGELCGVQFLAFSCAGRSYGGLARGLISSAAIAIGSRRVFHVDCLSDYFEIFTMHFYNATSEEYLRQWKSKRTTHKRNFIGSEAEPAFVTWAANGDFRLKFAKYDALLISSNSMAGLEGAVKSPTFRPVFNELFRDLSAVMGNNETTKYDVSIFASAILRIILGKPNNRLHELLDRCLFNVTPRWKETYRIGIQIRQSLTERHHACFVEELVRIVDSLATRRKIRQTKKAGGFLVFITSDNETSVGLLRNKISFHPRFKTGFQVVTSSDFCNDTLLNKPRAKNATNAWMDMAKPYVDWLFLTEMDRLIISRSGFAESASIFSLRPTSRLAVVAFNNSTKCHFQPYNSIGIGTGTRFDEDGL